MMRDSLCASIWWSILSINVTPFTSTMHFVLSFVSSFRRFPIPAAKITACILFFLSFSSHLKDEILLKKYFHFIYQPKAA